MGGGLAVTKHLMYPSLRPLTRDCVVGQSSNVTSSAFCMCLCAFERMNVAVIAVFQVVGTVGVG